MDLINLTDEELHALRNNIRAEVVRRRIASYTDPVEAAVKEACSYSNFDLLQPLFDAYQLRIGNLGAAREIDSVEEDTDRNGDVVLDIVYGWDFASVPVKWLKDPEAHIQHLSLLKKKDLEDEVTRALKNIEKLNKELDLKRKALEDMQSKLEGIQPKKEGQ